MLIADLILEWNGETAIGRTKMFFWIEGELFLEFGLREASDSSCGSVVEVLEIG